MTTKGMTVGETKRPGKTMTDLGLGAMLMAVVIGLLMAVTSSGGFAFSGFLIVAGLVFCAVGFCQRILAAVERR